MSEDFATDAVATTSIYPGGGTSPEGGSRATLTISYDAGSGSYTINLPGTSQTFQPSDKDASSSNAYLTRYVRNAATITDRLTLTNPGDQGPFNYRYVGAGIWQRTDTAGGIESNRLNVFTYGIRTPDAAMPRSGAASYAIGVTGMQASDSSLLRFDGAGQLNVDFAGGTFSGSGHLTTRTAAHDGYYLLGNEAFTVDGRVASGANALLGSGDFGSGFSAVSLSGHLYGPAAEEIGGSFYGPNNRNQWIAGALIGRTGSAPLEYETLNALLSPVSLQARSTSISYGSNAGAADFRGAALNGYVQGEILLTTAPVTYKWLENLDQSNLVAGQSNARFSTYKPDMFRTYRIYNTGSGNDELALTYTSFGFRELHDPQSNWIDELFSFGLETSFNQLPRNGHGIYQGVLYGSAVGDGNNADRFSLTGTAAFDFDFGAGTFAGSLNPTATNSRTQTVSNLGTYSFVNGQMPGATGMSNAFFGDIVGSPGATGRINGTFFGPQGQEIGGAFSLITPGAGVILTAAGAVVAKRQ